MENLEGKRIVIDLRAPTVPSAPQCEIVFFSGSSTQLLQQPELLPERQPVDAKEPRGLGLIVPGVGQEIFKHVLVDLIMDLPVDVLFLFFQRLLHIGNYRRCKGIGKARFRF